MRATQESFIHRAFRRPALKVDQYRCLEPGCQILDNLPEYEQGKLQVWPNPTNSFLNAQLPAGAKVESIVLVDALGRISNSLSLISDSGNTLKLEIPAGLYSLILTAKDGAVYSEKVVVE
jgi:hypothetical protein